MAPDASTARELGSITERLEAIEENGRRRDAKIDALMDEVRALASIIRMAAGAGKVLGWLWAGMLGIGTLAVAVWAAAKGNH